MTPVEFFSLATEWIFGDAIDLAPATDAEIIQFHYLSDWQSATVTWRSPSGMLLMGTVTEVDADGDAIWLFVEYMAVGDDLRTLNMTTWLTTADVNYIDAAPKQTTTAEAIAAR